MAANESEIKFTIDGEAMPVAATRGGAGPARGTVKASVRVGVRRGAAQPVNVTARPGEDLIVLTIANGPKLVLHPENARLLLQAQAAGTTRAATTADGGVVVGAQLGWPGLEAVATRDASVGWMGQATLGAFDVITNLLKDEAVTLATAAITSKLDGAVDEGVYALRPDKRPASLKTSGTKLGQVEAAAQPMLVLIHGTFVDTASTFGKLWDHPDILDGLFEHYGHRVYALDHPTVGKSPIGNALALARAMPHDARLHLVTHSRGGLVAEVLARACGGGPLTAQELAFFDEGRYPAQRQELEALVALAQERRLKVERMVRVACPSRGTLLASRRLDAYLSVLQWGLELAEVPVLPQLVDFLHEIARRRADPSELPGLEALMPESAFVAWLNSRAEPIPGELRVVAGDIQGDSVTSWVKTLLADAFYWTDNDLVVQTRSMYGGMPRAAGASGAAATFVLDRGGKVSHFNYFANASTVSAITAALTDDQPQRFAAIGPLSWAGESASGLRAANAVVRSRGGPAGDGADAAARPAVVVLPGILGSNLAFDGHRIWLGFGFINHLKKLAWDPATLAHIEPDGPVDGTYDDLIERLADTHEVVVFAFDWRRPIEDEANRLADKIDEKLAERAATGQPVRLLAHSMGGLVARAVQLERPQTWKSMMERDGARVLMLGTPNGGSWSPMQTLSGDDTFGNALVAFGSLFDNSGARKMMAGLPGFIQLQASLLDPALRLDQESTWKKLAADDLAALQARSLWHDPEVQRTIYEWGAPPQAVLDQAVALRRRLDAQLPALAGDADKMAMVVGHSRFTPAGMDLTQEGLEYLNAPDDGDGRVTLSSALLPGVRTWKVDAVHGKLPSVAGALVAYVELLASGTTDKLETLGPGMRGGAHAASEPGQAVRSRPSRTPQSSSQPPSETSDLLGLADEGLSGRQRAHAKAGPLRVSVLNGDLQFVSQPLLIGHYRSMRLTGTEGAVDALVDKAMSRALATGFYPDPPGTCQIFDNRRHNPDNAFEMARPSAVVVVGLGQEGGLRATDLSFAIRQAVLAYAQRHREQAGKTGTAFEMAATLVGSGGVNISAGGAAQAIVQGAVEANQRLLESGLPRLGHLTLIELYLDRAGEAWRALQQQQIAARDRLTLIGRVTSSKGSFMRPPEGGYRGAGYDFISVLSAADADRDPVIAFKLDTRRARTEVQAQRAQGNLVRQLVTNASNDRNTDPLIGRTLFNLLVPAEIEPFLGGSNDMVIELDSETATIPWELLDTRRVDDDWDEKPWAIRSRLIRKLQVKRNGAKPAVDATRDEGVLVIGEPKCKYAPLPAARNEAAKVADQLGSSLGSSKVRALIDQNDAQSIINALYEKPWRAIHIAGHGAVGRDGGVVLSGDDIYLGANEVRAMRYTPELVFLNCCHLAAGDAGQLLAGSFNRAEFAASVAEELIRCGVHCVIAAGWAVEDLPAQRFADAFYAALLKGDRFIDAVAAAREAALVANPAGNTWAAYQCYGDPDWTWQSQVGDAQRANSASPLPQDDEGIASAMSLVLALDTMKTEIEYRGADLKHQLRRIDRLAKEFGALWGGMGNVAAAFGAAYGAAKAADKAIEWYGRALKAEDGQSSLKAAEQMANLLVRRGDDANADPSRRREDIAAGVSMLEKLVQVQPTMERVSLLGSACKRLAVLETAGNDMRAALVALTAASKHYGEAEQLARQNGDTDIFYPAKNRVSCAWRAAFLKGKLPNPRDAQLKTVTEYVDKAASSKPDFWSVVGETEVRILQALARGKLAEALPAALVKLHDLKARVPAPLNWGSVYNEAQFTLVPYMAMERATGAEQQAARELLQVLEGMAAT